MRPSASATRPLDGVAAVLQDDDSGSTAGLPILPREAAAVRPTFSSTSSRATISGADGARVGDRAQRLGGLPADERIGVAQMVDEPGNGARLDLRPE